MSLVLRPLPPYGSDQLANGNLIREAVRQYLFLLFGVLTALLRETTFDVLTIYYPVILIYVSVSLEFGLFSNSQKLRV